MHAEFDEAISKAWEHADKLTIDSGIAGTLWDGTRVNQEAQHNHHYQLPHSSPQPTTECCGPTAVSQGKHGVHA